MGLQFGDYVVGHGNFVLQRYEGHDGLSLDLVVFANAGGFGRLEVIHQRRLGLDPPYLVDYAGVLIDESEEYVGGAAL